MTDEWFPRPYPPSPYGIAGPDPADTVVEVPTPPPTVPVPAGPQIVLRITAGAGEGLTIPLNGPAITLGRQVDNTLPLADRKVSRYHARIERVDNSWVITDLDSTNGIRLNGLPVTRAGLSPGDFLYLGDVILRVETV